MKKLSVRIHHSVSEFCHRMAEEQQRGYAQAAWFAKNGLEQIEKELEKESFLKWFEWFEKAKNLGYGEDDVVVLPYISTHGSWMSWTSVNLRIEIYGEYTIVERFCFPRNSELPKAFVTPFLEREGKEAKIRAQKEAEVKAARAAEKEAAEAERLAWIEAAGSDYLQRAVKLGYNCQRQYVTERAAVELPLFDVDFDNNADWKDRSCPSPEALNEVEELIAAGHKATVVWLTASVRPPIGDSYECCPYDEDACDAACEAIIITKYLGRYSLVRII